MDGGKHFSFEQYKLADATRDRYKIILGQCKSLCLPVRFLYRIEIIHALSKLLLTQLTSTQLDIISLYNFNKTYNVYIVTILDLVQLQYATSEFTPLEATSAQ